MTQQRKNLTIMMADHIPFDIQTIIIKKLPTKSLIRFRCVSKQWKSLIESSKFIKNYESMNDPHLLVRYNVQQYHADIDGYLSIIDEYVSILDNDTFPQHISPVTVPLSVMTLERARILCSRYEHARILGSSCGLICFHGYHKDHSEMVVFWNPSIKKSISVLLEPHVRLATGWVGFGVCPETCDPKLVKIDKVNGILEVHVYTLSTRAWKKVSIKSQYESCHLRYHKGVCVGQFIYWLERDDSPPPLGNESYSIVSFDLSNDEFGKLYLPKCLQLSECLMLSKWNECLTVIDYSYSNMYDTSFNYWVMKYDGAAQSFAKMFRVNPIYPKSYNEFELMKNGKAIIETKYENNFHADPILQVYDPCSGHVDDIRIPWSGHDGIGETASFFSTSSYIETLLLLDQ